MRGLKAALLALTFAGAGAGGGFADWVPPIKGNDTGGIISTSLIGRVDVDAVAISHCAYYGKVPVRLSAPHQLGEYLSFACKWVPPGSEARPLHTRY